MSPSKKKDPKMKKIKIFFHQFLWSFLGSFWEKLYFPMEKIYPLPWEKYEFYKISDIYAQEN